MQPIAEKDALEDNCVEGRNSLRVSKGQRMRVKAKNGEATGLEKKE